MMDAEKMKVKQNEEYYESLIEKIWEKYDADGDGQIDKGEMKEFVNDMLNDIDGADS